MSGAAARLLAAGGPEPFAVVLGPGSDVELGIAGTELAGAERAGRKLIRLAPPRESGYRYLMQALTAQDNLAEALQVHRQLRDTLRDQLGVSPSPATRDLYQRLLSAT